MVRTRPWSPLPAVTLASVLVLTACSSEPETTVETAEVTSGEVVQTVAAVAELEPASRVTVTAPLSGEVAELFVEDGDTIAAGDPVARLTSESLDLQIAQAEAAVQSADALGGAAGAAGAGGVDLSPLFGAFRGQLDATLPPILDTLAEQVAAIENDELREAAQARVTDARTSYQEAAGQLRDAEEEAAGQAAAASAAQREAVAAQRRQAELALEAAEGRGDDLLVVAPADGVVELARAEGGGAGGGVPDLGGLTDQLGGGGVPDLGGADVGALLGDGGADGGGAAGPVAEGVSVGTGQAMVTIYDLSSFTARVEVDEIDIVEVAEDQGVTVLVDAFPATELRGRVDHVALAPVSGPTGGSVFPVTVQLTEVPDEVELRVGLTASAEIEVRQVDADAVVPTSALLRRGGAEVVFVVVDDVVREVPVEVVALGDQTAAVEGDLDVSDRVVTTGIEDVSDGDEL